LQIYVVEKYLIFCKIKNFFENFFPQKFGKKIPNKIFFEKKFCQKNCEKKFFDFEEAYDIYLQKCFGGIT